MITALKLFKVGTTKLLGGSSLDDMIRRNSSDEQLALHLDEGVACQVLMAEIWDEDNAGMQATIAEDSMNASLDMATNEMEVLTFFAEEVHTGKSAEDCLAAAKARFGTSAFGEPDLKSLYIFALRVPPTLARNLCELHFALIPQALCRCPPRHFGAIARIGGLSPVKPTPHSKALDTCVKRMRLRT